MVRIEKDLKVSKIIKGTFESRMSKLLNVKPSLLKDILRPSSIAACRLNLLKGIDRLEVIKHAKKHGITLTPISFYKDGFLTDTPKYELINLDLVKDGIFVYSKRIKLFTSFSVRPKT